MKRRRGGEKVLSRALIGPINYLEFRGGTGEKNSAQRAESRTRKKEVVTNIYYEVLNRKDYRGLEKHILLKRRGVNH